MSHGALMQLQRQAGNAAVGRLFADRPPHRAALSGQPQPVQRFAVCEPARWSAVDCPPRDPGEKAKARSGAMSYQTVSDVDGRSGGIAFGFDIGSDAVKSSLRSAPYWKPFIDSIRKDGSQWDILGFTDCAGEDVANAQLRKQRADALRAALPLDVRAQIVSSEAAPGWACITENANAQDRTLNRSAVLLVSKSTINYTKGSVLADRLKRQAPKSKLCDDEQRARLAIAWPLGQAMAKNARAIISYMEKGSREEALFKKFFGPNAFARRWKIKIRYNNTLRAWNTNPTFYCVKASDPPFLVPDIPAILNPCSDGKTEAETGVRALLSGGPITLCDKVWGNDTIGVAGTLLHEMSHALDWTGDPKYCDPSGCTGLSTSTAEGNASSYEYFASEAYRLWP